jgi:nitrite reductase/ring-hydroxylating ferredoxin subunit
VQLCRINDVLVGDLKQFNIRGNEILVVNVNGQFVCLEARCTHAGAPLAEGAISGDVLTCPWHGSRFNIKNGSVLRGPAEKPLRVYSFVIRENALFVEL